METVQQNGRFTLYNKFHSNIYSILYAYNLVKCLFYPVEVYTLYINGVGWNQKKRERNVPKS